MRLAGSWTGNHLVLAPFPCPSPRWHLAAEFWCPQGKVSPPARSLAQPGGEPPGPQVLVTGRILHRCCWGCTLSSWLETCMSLLPERPFALRRGAERWVLAAVKGQLTPEQGLPAASPNPLFWFPLGGRWQAGWMSLEVAGDGAHDFPTHLQGNASLAPRSQ